MKSNLKKFAAALLFASVAISCSLTMWASPLVHGKALAVSNVPGKGTTPGVIGTDPTNPLGNVTIVPPFDMNYSFFELGTVPGVQTAYGGLTFKYDDPNTLLIGGGANSAVGRIYQIAVTRDANGHVTGFSGGAILYPSAGSTIGQYNDGGVAFGPDNVLFVTRYPTNQLEQSKVGSLAPDKVVDLAPVGVAGSVGSIGFVPQGFPGAGGMKVVSYSDNGWYHCDFVPDGNGTFNVISAIRRVNVGGGPEGIAFVPPGSPVFPVNSVLIAQYGYGKVVTAPLDANGDPIVANMQDFIQGFSFVEGACIDPVTGDFLFSTFTGETRVVGVSGFQAPSTPTPTPTPTVTATATPTATPTATATATPTVTPTPTPTATATATPTPTPTATATATPCAAPTVTTSAASNVASSSTTLNGMVNPNGCNTIVHFQYGTTTGYGSTTANQTKTGNTTQNVAANVSGLAANTTYHFRIVATNSGGTRYGSDRTFTTTQPPTVTTKPATNVASFSASLNGTVNPHGLSTTVRFQYGRTTSYGSTTANQTKTGNTTQNVAANISGLSPSHLYHFRIVATNGGGTSFGPDRTFTTLAATGPPVVTTNPASNITTSSARLNGSLDPHGLTTTVYFKWGTTTSYGHTTPTQTQTGNTYRNITANISGLTRHHTYHFRIVATNSTGTRMGRDLTFSTP